LTQKYTAGLPSDVGLPRSFSEGSLKHRGYKQTCADTRNSLPQSKLSPSRAGDVSAKAVPTMRASVSEPQVSASRSSVSEGSQWRARHRLSERQHFEYRLQGASTSLSLERLKAENGKVAKAGSHGVVKGQSIQTSSDKSDKYVRSQTVPTSSSSRRPIDRAATGGSGGVVVRSPTSALQRQAQKTALSQGKVRSSTSARHR